MAPVKGSRSNDTQTYLKTRKIYEILAVLYFSRDEELTEVEKMEYEDMDRIRVEGMKKGKIL